MMMDSKKLLLFWTLSKHNI